MKLPILTYLDLSTAHITASDALLLDKAIRLETRGPVIYAAGDYGWFIPMTDDMDWTPFGQMSEAFHGLIKLALENGCDMLRLDRDAPRLDTLPVFSW